MASRPDRRAEDRFLRHLGSMARRYRATLYYPAAGLDLSSVLTTRIPKSILLDPAYLRRGRIDLRAIKRAVRSIDPEARFDRISPHVVTVVLRQHSGQRTITFIRGAAGRDEHLVEARLRGRCVFLAKGCLVPAVLCPPADLENLTPVAYGLQLVDLPRYSATIRAGYANRVLDLRSAPTWMVIYKRYKASPRRAANAERAWRELLASARSRPRRAAKPGA